MADTETPVRSYASLIGLIYVFNLIVGTGALALPKAFHDAGYILGVVLLALIALISYMSASFIIESMSACNALVTLSKRRTYSHASSSSVPNVSSEFAADNSPLLRRRAEGEGEGGGSFDTVVETPVLDPKIFEIKRQVEVCGMASLLLNRPGIVTVYLFLIIYLLGDLAVYASIVPKSIMNVICSFSPPGPNHTCISNETYDSSWPCIRGNPRWLTRLSVYRLLCLIFAVFAGVLVSLGISKGKYLQIFTSISRWTAFTLMLILTSRLMVLGDTRHNSASPVNFNGFGQLFGVSVYAFMCHHSLPALITPIKCKSHVYPSVGGVFSLIFLFYIALSFTGLYSFGDTIQDVYTLNFFPNCRQEQSVVLTIFGYFLALYPVFTLSTNFPIVAITLANNLKHLMTLIFDADAKLSKHQILNDNDDRILGCVSEELNSGQDCEQVVPLRSWQWIVHKYVIPLVVTSLPILIAIGTDNVEVLASITGAYAGVGVQYIIPALLIINSRSILGYKFGIKVPSKYTSPFSSIVYPVFLCIWAFVTTVIVTINIIMNKKF